MMFYSKQDINKHGWIGEKIGKAFSLPRNADHHLFLIFSLPTPHQIEIVEAHVMLIAFT
jgi:hypothetical protein